MNTAIEKNTAKPAPIEDDKVTTQAIKRHAKTFSSLNVDGKSILLVDQLGQVQEPTKLTVSLLGVKAAGKKRLSKEVLSSPNEDQELDQKQDEILSLKKPRKKGCKSVYGAMEPDQAQADSFKCPYENCQKEFNQRTSLKAHLAYHKSRPNFACPVASCNKVFNYRHNLSMHMRVHNNLRPFECPQKCGKSFRTKGNMIDHLRRHYAIK